ncbi:KCNQ2 isoform 44, partial [Pongo abelii]
TAPPRESPQYSPRKKKTPLARPPPSHHRESGPDRGARPSDHGQGPHQGPG